MTQWFIQSGLCFTLDTVIKFVLLIYFGVRNFAPVWPSVSTSLTLGNVMISLYPLTWWRHQMETSSALLAICAGNSPVNGEFPAQRPVTRSFDVFIDLRLNKRLSKQWWGWWFETPSRPLWRLCNEIPVTIIRCYTYGMGPWTLLWMFHAIYTSILQNLDRSLKC